MPKVKLLQTATLLFFVGLIALFVAYRGGLLDSLLLQSATGLQTSPNGGPVAPPPAVPKDSSRLRLYSSKSGTIITPALRFKPDYKKKAKPSSTSLTQTGKVPVYPQKGPAAKRLSSSKSIIIFKPSDSLKTRE